MQIYIQITKNLTNKNMAKMHENCICHQNLANLREEIPRHKTDKNRYNHKQNYGTK